MPSAEDLRALLERVRSAKGPDRELNLDLAVALVDASKERGWHGWQSMRGRGEPERPARAFWEVKGFPVTASIDAADALVQRQYPGTMWAVGNMEAGPFCRLLIPHAGGWRLSESVEQDGGAQTAPLAILAALLTAEIAALEPGHAE